jgi:hypothetical protein
VAKEALLLLEVCSHFGPGNHNSLSARKYSYWTANWTEDDEAEQEVGRMERLAAKNSVSYWSGGRINTFLLEYRRLWSRWSKRQTCWDLVPWNDSTKQPHRAETAAFASKLSST